MVTDSTTIHDRERAIIYIHAPGEVRHWAAMCLSHVEHRGYDLVSLVDDHDGTAWPDVINMVKEDRADVVVVGSWSQLPPYRKPRVEMAERWPEPPQRRPTIIR